MDIISPAKAGKALTAGINRLVSQLTDSPQMISGKKIQEIIESETSHLLVAVDRGAVLGMLTIAVYAIPTGVRAVIEDLVVDSTVRGKGIGRALLRQAIARAGALGADHVNLTSNPSRKAAHHLYRKLGFHRRETHVYRFPLKENRSTTQ